MPALHAAARIASSTGGKVLSGAARLVATRPADKPLHPRGTVVSGTLQRFGDGARSGVAWLDEAGRDDVLVRLSRALGLPSSVPDIFGLALRVPLEAGGYGDLLFASTGLGRLTRFTLTAARSPYRRPMTTLLPYRTPTGPVILCATFAGDRRTSLAWAKGTAPWHPFAVLALDEEPRHGGDEPLSFDPIRNCLPGLDNYRWVERLREPSYAAARRSRQS
jgi:hypothetical protein